MDIENKHKKSIHKILKDVFGYNNFRDEQEDIILNTLSGYDSLVIMPTGGGKSICYQIPAIFSPGTAIIISPLIALMKNQVDQMQALGVEAEFLNSTLTKAKLKILKEKLRNQVIKMLYIAPESLSKEENIEFLKQINISLFAIDEAHCISEWGHDFRIEYRKILEYILLIGKKPIMALTATATLKVRIDIQDTLHIKNAKVFVSSFNRQNLFYEVRSAIDVDKQMVQFIKARLGQSGIVYCFSRKIVEDVSELLSINGIKALPYHAGMENKRRSQHQDAFLNEDVDVIVATIAFGMGIDKPNVRYIIHYNLPKSLEGYYQETGRAGRDFLDSYCLMFYSPNDVKKLDRMNNDKVGKERDSAKILLKEIKTYAISGICRRKQLLYYFGEYLKEDCGNCDNCKFYLETIGVTQDWELLFNMIKQTDQTLEQRVLLNLLVENLDKEYKAIEDVYKGLDLVGKGKNKNRFHWKYLIHVAIQYNFLNRDDNNYWVIRLTEKGHNFLKYPEPILIPKPRNYISLPQEQENNSFSITQGCDRVLLEMLKNLRNKIAKKNNKPPYIIFQDNSLQEMATLYPKNIQQLQQISGVGASKAEKFGGDFLKTISKYIEENDIETVFDIAIKSKPKKSKDKIYIIQQIDKKVDLEQIAKYKDLSFDELIQEIEHICYSGTKLDINYYLSKVMDKEQQKQLYDSFYKNKVNKNNVTDFLKYVNKEEFSEEEARLMHIKFFSEQAL